MDSRLRAALGSFVFLLLAPGVVAGLIPWWLTDWETDWTFLPLQAVGFALIVAGVVVLLNAFTRFVLEGLGTPAPVAPTEKLVVGGLYRHVRNPMYLAVAAIIFGQAFLLGRTVLLAYGLLFLAVVAAFVRFYEEPTLTRQFGEDYEAYKRAVPGWWPRRSPWRPPDQSTPPRPEEPRPGSDPGHGPS
jgi:protein-S-isoprenylcysteine O-methyltransferase Ste14